MSGGRRTELVEGDDGPRLAKVAVDEHGENLLAQEATRLRAARHPGVVELVHQDDDRIETAWAGDRTLELAAFDLDGAAALLAAVAATVADLHDLGVIHGRLDPTHVVVGPDGGPRLCGMRGPLPDEPRPSTADDVEALGRLIHRLVGEGTTIEPIPERRWRRRRWSGYQQRALQNLADQAQAHDAGRRPSARTLATSIAEVAPGARLARPASSSAVPEQARLLPSTIGEDVPPTAAEPEPEPATEPTSTPDRSAAAPRDEVRSSPTGPAPRDRHRGRLVAGPAAVVLGLAAFAVVGTDKSGPSTSDAAPRASGSAPTSDRPPDTDDHRGSEDRHAANPPSTTAAAPAPPATTAAAGCTPVVRPAADVDADGCPDPILIDGNTITAGDAVFRAGDTDDQVTLGDWHCTGEFTPGIVRPSTGEVYLFDRWPSTDEPVEVEPVAIVPGGRRIVAEDSSCGPPAVEASGGVATQLTLEEGDP